MIDLLLQFASDHPVAAIVIIIAGLLEVPFLTAVTVITLAIIGG
jgi:hypothetical protein